MNVSNYQHIIKASTEWDRATFLRKKAAALIAKAEAIEAAIHREHEEKHPEEYE